MAEELSRINHELVQFHVSHLYIEGNSGGTTINQEMPSFDSSHYYTSFILILDYLWLIQGKIFALHQTSRRIAKELGQNLNDRD